LPTREYEKSRQRPIAGIDPFAVKISIPPLVLLGYVVWKSFTAEDPRMRSIREAKTRHEILMKELEQEKLATS